MVTEADKKIGMKIREYRLAAGVSQKFLADKIGVAWQQIQKYERGSSRAAAARVWEIANALGVPISKFFDDEDEGLDIPAEAERMNVSEYRVREVVKLFGNLDGQHRLEAVEFMKSAAKARTEEASQGESVQTDQGADQITA